MSAKNNNEKCNDSWWWETDEKWTESNDLFHVEVTGGLEKEGITPHTVAIIVKMKEPRDITYFDTGAGEVVAVASGTEKRIFDHIYGSGEYTVCIMCRSNPKGDKRFWQKESFHFKVKTKKEAEKEDPDCIISNFFQGSGGGQYTAGSIGLDVDFSISLSAKPYSIMWLYSDNLKEEKRQWGPVIGPKSGGLTTAHHTYKEKGLHEGYVEVIDWNGHKCTREINVAMTDLD